MALTADEQQILDDFTAMKERAALLKQENPLNNQHGGDHYRKLAEYQPWQVMAKWMTPEELRGYMKGTVCAYLCRERDKGGDDDIKKALHTMQIYMEVKG